MTVKTAVACPEPEDGPRTARRMHPENLSQTENPSQTEDGGRASERGLATAEYAIATLAAAAFAGALMAILSGGDVKGMLTSLIQSALSAG